MNTVFTIQFVNHIYEDGPEYDENHLEDTYNKPMRDDKILDNKVYMNPEDAILALQSILDTLSMDEERFVEEGMHVYSVASYELV